MAAADVGGMGTLGGDGTAAIGSIGAAVGAASARATWREAAGTCSTAGDAIACKETSAAGSGEAAAVIAVNFRAFQAGSESVALKPA